MKKIKTETMGTAVFAAAVFFLLTLTGCDLLNIVIGNGTIKAKSYDLKNFTTVSCSGKWTVHIDRGTDFSVKIISDENLIPFFDVFVSGSGTLYVKERSTYHLESTEQKLFITMPALKRLNAAGSLSGFISDFNQPSDELLLSLSGSGAITAGPLIVQKINLQISGSGTVCVTGKAPDMEAAISGSGTIKARELETDNAAVSIPGSGLVEVWAKNTLNASISGSGSIRYKGNPSITQNISGSGSLKQL